MPETAHAQDVPIAGGETIKSAPRLGRETGPSRLFSGHNVALCTQVLREAASAITRPVGELRPTSTPVPTRLHSESPSAWWGRSRLGMRRWSSGSGPSPSPWPSATPW
jgi:hypothetical protein